jgi:hypothetical protein
MSKTDLFVVIMIALSIGALIFLLVKYITTDFARRKTKSKLLRAVVVLGFTSIIFGTWLITRSLGESSECYIALISCKLLGIMIIWCGIGCVVSVIITKDKRKH